MKKAFLSVGLLLLFIIFSKNLEAEFWNQIASFNIGKQPAGFIYDDKNQTINIFCAGYDSDFNGQKGDADQSPSWWQAKIVPSNTPNQYLIEEPYLVREFEFGSFQFPFRPGYFYPKLYYSSFQNIETYNIGNFEKINNNLPNITASALTANEDFLLISHRPSFTEPGYVYVYNLLTEEIIDTLKAGVNVQRAYFYNNDKIIVLNEGDFGAGNSSIQIFKKNENKFALEKSIITGDVTNHITISDNFLIATNNGSHDITIINLENQTIQKKIKLPTEGFSGPRESIYSPKLNRIITSCWDGKIYIHNLDGDFLGSFETEGNPEGMLLIENKIPLLFVANEFKKNTYEPNTSFQIFAGNITSTNDLVQAEPILIFNYGLNIIQIENLDDFQQNTSFLVFNSSGNLVFNEQKNIYSNRITLDLSGSQLASGFYFLIILSDFKSLSFPFIITR